MNDWVKTDANSVVISEWKKGQTRVEARNVGVIYIPPDPRSMDDITVRTNVGESYTQSLSHYRLIDPLGPAGLHIIRACRWVAARDKIPLNDAQRRVLMEVK